MKTNLFAWMAMLPLALAGTLGLAGEDEPRYDRIRLSTRVQADIDNDLVIAVLYAQREGTDATALAGEVNRAVAWGLEQVKAVPGVRAQTLGYQTTPLYTKQTLTGWRVRQSLRLEGSDAGALSALVGTLQQQLAVQGIEYAISPQARREAEDRLIVDAVAAFRQRADLLAKSWGQPDYRLVEMQVNTQGEPPRPLMRAMAMEMQAAAPPPPIEAGTQVVVVNVDGAIELRVR